jgi:hypothetical protein
MRGAILSLPQYDFMSRCLVKHRDNFYFTQRVFIVVSVYFFIDLVRKLLVTPLYQLSWLRLFAGDVIPAGEI